MRLVAVFRSITPILASFMEAVIMSARWAVVVNWAETAWYSASTTWPMGKLNSADNLAMPADNWPMSFAWPHDRVQLGDAGRELHAGGKSLTDGVPDRADAAHDHLRLDNAARALPG